ncbi:MAG: DUF6062 family protein [Chloroflexota bacterium]
MAQRIPYYDEMLIAFAEPGCAFCRLLDASSDRLVDAVLFEMVNDVGVREELNAARGYCRRHAELLVRTGSALGSATMMQGVLKVLIRRIDAGETDQTAASRLRGLARSVNADVSHPAVRNFAASSHLKRRAPFAPMKLWSFGKWPIRYWVTLRRAVNWQRPSAVPTGYACPISAAWSSAACRDQTSRRLWKLNVKYGSASKQNWRNFYARVTIASATNRSVTSAIPGDGQFRPSPGNYPTI